MYERFTDRARKVMAYANQEAQRLNHEYIACEHLFLGIIKEGSGVASSVLRDNNVNLEQARLEIQKLVPAGPEIFSICSKLPNTPRAKKAIEAAINAARELNHNYVGTEHILLGILREGDNIATQVLEKMGLSGGAVKASILKILDEKKETTKQKETKLEEGLPPVSKIKIWVAFIGEDKIAQGIIAYSFDEALEKAKRHYKNITGLTEIGEAIL